MANILDRNTDFLTNGTVTSAGLHNLIDDANIYAGLISTQAEKTTVGTADLVLVADSSSIGSPQIAANRTTVYNLFEDALTGGTYVNANFSANLTYGTATGNRTVSTSATITTGTIPTLTTGTTTSTAEIITSGTIATLNSTTGTITNLRSTTGTVATLNSTTGTIANLSTTLAGDFTISQGTGTLGTTGATAATYGTTSAIPVLTVDAKGRVTSGTSATNPVGFRNRIINGDMQIDQRNAGSAVTVATGTTGYTLDRFFAYQNSPSTLVQASRNTSAPSGFQNSIKLGRNGSGVAGLVVFGQALETSNCLDAQGGTVTLSFYAKAGANFSAASSQIGVTLYSGTGTDQSALSMVTGAWTGTATPISSTAILTTSWQRFTFTSTSLGASVSQLGMTLNWTNVGTAGADDNVYITGVQLEVGSTATDFERRPIGAELALCQRYCYVATSEFIGCTVGSIINVVGGSFYFPQTMRASPTFTNGSFTVNTGNSGTFAAINITSRAAQLYNSANNWTASANVSVTATASAEL